MTPNAFNNAMKKMGFSREKHPLSYPMFKKDISGSQWYVCRDSVRGSAWRLFMGVNRIPAMDSSDVSGYECESPWFEYMSQADLDELASEEPDLDLSDAMNKEAALAKCIEWLQDVGMSWLKDPEHKTKDQWRVEHDILQT